MATDFDSLIEAEENREPYRFTLGGKDWSLPHIADLKLRQQRAIDEFRVDAVAREVVGDELADLLLESKGRVMAQIHVEWLSHAGHKPGESGASSS